MKFVCDRCQTKYSIADEKVRGKVLKVRCKTCQNVITVREAGVRPSVAGLAPVRSTQRPSSPNLAPLVGYADDEREKSERTVLTSAPAALMAELAQKRRPTPPPPPPVGDGVEWFLAIEGAQQGPFSRKGLVDKLALFARDADVHVWNDRMDGWKPPADVPDVARELAAKRAPVGSGLPTRPPVPRTTPSPPVPPLAARRGTMPLVSGLGLGAKLPGPLAGAAVAHAHAVPAPHAHAPVAEPLAAHRTPPPAAKPTNGLAAHGVAAPAAPLARPFAGGESDALSALNLGGVAAKPAAAAAAPRIMEVGEATAWSGQGRVSEGRHRSTKMIVALMLLVGVSVVMITINFTKKSTAVVVAPPTKTALDSEALAKLSAQAAQDNAREPAKAEPSEGAKPREATGAPEPQRRGPHGRPLRGRAVAAHGGTNPGAFTGTGTVAAPSSSPTTSPTTTAGGGFQERKVGPAPVSSRPPPNQSDISRVIANNKLGIKTCYQRALLRDSNLTHGKIVVGVTIGISGRVKHVTVDGPSSFRALEPCIKEMLARWVFPQSSEEYGTEFSYLFQGNE